MNIIAKSYVAVGLLNEMVSGSPKMKELLGSTDVQDTMYDRDSEFM